MAFVLSVLLWFTDSDYPSVSFGLCVVCPYLIYRFWLPLQYLMAFVLSVLLWFTDSDYPFCSFLPLCCLSFFDLQILITPSVSFGLCVVCPSLIYRFWLPLRCLLAFVLSVLLWFTYSDYPFSIFWPLCCLSFFDLQILITPSVSFGLCIVCPSLIYRFWLPLQYLMAFVLSDLLWFTDSDYPFSIFWPLCCLSFFDLQILITPSVSFGLCIVCPSLIYRFWLPLQYLLAFVLSVLLWFTDSDYPFSIFWPLCCLSLFDLQILITPSVSFGLCVVCPSLIYRFWLPLQYLLAFVLSVLLWFTDSDYPFSIFWLCVVCPSLIYRFWLPLQYRFWPLCCLSFFDLQILITPSVSFGLCVVCPSLIYRFWLPLQYLLAFVLSVLLWFTDSDYLFSIFWPLCCLSFFDLRILITPSVSFGLCVVCPSLIYRFWLPFQYLLAFVLSVLLWFTDSDYPFSILWPFCIFWPLCCLSFFDLQILITPSVPYGLCVVCPSLIYRFWLPLQYLLAFVLFVLLWFTDSDYPFSIFWPLCCLSFFDLQILITLQYLLAFVLSVLLWFTDSDYPFSILWPLCCLSFFDLQILITLSVSFGLCVVCPSLIYGFWLPLQYLVTFFSIFWPLYLLAFVLSVLLWFTDSDYPFSTLWPLCCLSFFDLQILITPSVSFGLCVVCPSLIYRFWLPLQYLLAFVLSVLLWFTDSDYPSVSFGLCVVCPSLIYGFWLPLR